MPDKEFTQWLDCGRILAWRDIQSGRIVSFVVLLIAEIAGREHCVARYDTAHVTPHRDILGIKKGLLEKEWFFESSSEEVFDYAIRDFQANAQEHIRFFLAH